ncbi:putative T7SS-secreted protein [Streptomyces sp. NPDC029554]|uniref:WXG100 family type VII secretion target n=1 Tax=Streptomyces sp. NPDC029554 TaxID=3155126 RepID=UPI0033F9D72C
MTRPAAHRWEVLGESDDPVPGDVHDMKALARRFTATAETITKTADALRRIGNLESWDSEAGRAFAEKASETAKTVSKAHDRYADAGIALKDYSTDLETIQGEADKLLTRAETQQNSLSTAKNKRRTRPRAGMTPPGADSTRRSPTSRRAWTGCAGSSPS